MNSSLEKGLIRAAALTFEELSFMLPSLDISHKQQEADANSAVTVAFHGPFSGHLTMIVYGNLPPTFAGNMLGEEETTVEQQNDAVREIVNVICGNLLPHIAGTQAVFNIDTPLNQSVAEARAESEPATARLRIGLDEGWTELVLRIDSETPSQASTNR